MRLGERRAPPRRVGRTAAWLDWLLLGAYFAVLIVIGVQTMRRIKSPDDFAVAGNRIVWPVFFGSLAAAFLGGGASLGVAGATIVTATST